jgi:hypothetical protein
MNQISNELIKYISKDIIQYIIDDYLYDSTEQYNKVMIQLLKSHNVYCCHCKKQTFNWIYFDCTPVCISCNNWWDEKGIKFNFYAAELRNLNDFGMTTTSKI